MNTTPNWQFTISKTCLITAICAVITFGQIDLAAGQTQTNSAQTRIMATFKELVDSKGGVIEPIRIKEGLVIVITVKNPDQIKSVQEAADRCFADLHKLKKEDIDSSRVKIYEDIKQNKITEQVEKTSTGLLILYTSQDSNCVAEVRAQDTCDWCVCKSQDTSNGCKACCP